MARIAASEPHVSWTAFVIASVARAVAMHPEVNARKAGNAIVSFDRVDIGATVERHWQGRTVLDVVMVPDADQQSCAAISQTLQRAKYGPGEQHRPSGLTGALIRLPGPLRRTAIRVAATRPAVAATFGPAVGVTSIGMFAGGWGWAIPARAADRDRDRGPHRGPRGRARRGRRGPADAAAHAEL